MKDPTTITDEQAKIIGREIGDAIARKLSQELGKQLGRGQLGSSLGDRFIDAVEKGFAGIAAAVKRTGS